MNNKLEIKTISSLIKVFPNQNLEDTSLLEGSALRGEVYSFQIAYKIEEGRKNLSISIDKRSDLSALVTIRNVGLIPCEFSCYEDHDDNILKDTAGLYPDALYPVSDGDWFRTYPKQWRSAWVTVKVPTEFIKGVQLLKFNIEDEEKKIKEEICFKLTIVGESLPEQKLINTHWFHGDCLASYYEDKIFSEQHWIRLEEQFKNAAAHGMNLLLTPVFTPPLDTKVGGERPTIQLVDVFIDGEKYNFDFKKLEKWIDLAIDSGFKYIEVSHLATQWGAEFCPKIIAKENGIEKKIFGWETKSLSFEYINFLDQFLPELDHFFIKKGIKDNIYFHVSDEPELEHLTQFQKFSHELKSRLEGYKFIDAISNLEFYKTGAVPTPVPSNDHIKPFIEAGVNNLWVYYCCMQYKGVSNRFFNMPSSRNRIIGIQLYKYKIKGFLHWGYNFYYSQFSIKKINPFINTDAGGGFPSGDSFMVYPGENGPIDSLRNEVFFEGLQDLRALELLESLTNRCFVLDLLESDLQEKITFDKYPKSATWLLEKRELINNTISELIKS